jgi:hypothetical protein
MGYSFTNTAATTAAVANRYVTSTNMKVGAYTLANTTPVWSGAGLVTVTHTTVVTTDTLGTITVVGVDLSGTTRTESITPIADSVATGTIPFRTITSITGVGWVIAGSNDTLVCGVAAGNIACGSQGTLQGVLVNNTVATAFSVADATRTIMTIPASQAAGTFYDLGGGVDFGGYLKVLTTSTNDVTVFHSGTSPAIYAL